MGFWTSNRRQYGVIMIVNLVTFLQGASVGTSAISIPRMPTNESSLDDTIWPLDFVVTDEDAFWISKYPLLLVSYENLTFLSSDESWLISHIASGLVSNSVADVLGRKKSLVIDCLAFLLGYALYAVGGNVSTLCIARAFLGYPLVTTVGSVILNYKSKVIIR